MITFMGIEAKHWGWAIGQIKVYVYKIMTRQKPKKSNHLVKRSLGHIISTLRRLKYFKVQLNNVL